MKDEQESKAPANPMKRMVICLWSWIGTSSFFAVSGIVFFLLAYFTLDKGLYIPCVCCWLFYSIERASERLVGIKEALDRIHRDEFLDI